MNDTQKYPLKERFVEFSKYASLMVVFIGILSLIGWVLDIQVLRSISPNFQSTKVNTAIVFILSGIVLLFSHTEKLKKTYSYIKQALSFVIFLIGLLTLLQYVFNLNFGIDQFLLKDLYTSPDSFPGRMSFASSVCTILIGIALIWIDHPKEKIRNLSQYPAAIVIAISFLAIIGYLYDAQALYRLGTYSTMGVNTATGFVLCALTILWVRPDEGWTKIIIAESAGGFVLRRLLLPLLVAPLILGWFVLLGAKTGWYETHFGLAIISVLITGFLIVTLLVNGEQLNRINQNRKQAEERYRNVLDNLLEGAQIIGFDWRYLYVNDAAVKQGRQAKENLIGRTMMEAYPGIEDTAVYTTIKLCMEERTSHMMENECTYPDGVKGWFELSIQPVEEGVFILSNDITERKKNEIDLLKLNAELEQRIFEEATHLNFANAKLQNELFHRQQAELHYRSLFEQSNDAVFILDLKGNHVMVNQHAADMLGYTAKEIQKLSYADLSAELEKSEQVMNRLLAGERIPLFERLFRKKSGEVFPVEINVELVRDDLGNPLYIQSIVRDITKRKKIEEAINRRNKMLSDLHEITLELLKQNSPENLLQKIVDLSSEFLDATYAGITLIEGDTLTVKAVTQNQIQLLGQKLRRDDAKLTWQAFDTRQIMVLKDYDTWERRRKDYWELGHYAVADFPILNGDECLGVLALGREKPNYEFSEEQIQFGGLFASIIALIISNSQLKETLRQQSIRDSLTGLFNRRYMEETLKQEISRAMRQNYPLGIIMIDIDHFKNFNDSFGHQAGDSLLSQFGQFLQTNIRAEDIACRYGGEEFLLILPNSQLEVIQQRAEFLREGAMNLHVFDNEKIFTGIAISAGIAMYPQHGANIEDLIRSADNALYQAKQNGRNQVMIAKNSN